MRSQRSLAGKWAFQLDPDGVLTSETLQPDQEITVPLPWQVAFPELRAYSGYGWYQRTFTLDAAALTGEVILRFGAVDYWCQVYLNGQYVGEHEGGHTAFEFAVRQWMQPGENTLTVRVYDSSQRAIVIPRWRQDIPPENTSPPFAPESIPHGKQTWYLDASGLWQDVTLTFVPATYLRQIHITPDIQTGTAQVKVWLAGQEQAGNLRLQLAGQTAEVPITACQQDATLAIQVAQPTLWSPEQPHLYQAEVYLETASGTDQQSVRFGFREITIRDGYLLLNGEPLYLLCALDQDLYPETIYTVPSTDFLCDQFTKAKQLGLNILRCHIKPPDPRYFELADEMGLLVWSEIPSWRTFHPKNSHPTALHLDEAIKTRVRETLRDMIARDYNHPSLIIWTIVNEDWGTSLLLSEDDRAWVAEMFDYCKQLDPTRLVVDNSPCPAPWGLSVHVKSDLDDFHIYANIPDQAGFFEQTIEQFGLRPLWTYSNTGDAQRTGQEPLILSEFGNWGMPTLQPYQGQEPDWFDLSGWWSPWDGEAGYPAGVLKRFEQLGLHKIWQDYIAFAEATQWHQYQALKFEIETMRRQPGIQGYVITELSDIYWESNGLLDFERGTKVFHERFAYINALDVILPHLRRYAFWENETAEVTLYASHYSPANWQNSVARAAADGQEIFTTSTAAIGRGSVQEIGAVQWQMPAVQKATLARLSLTIEKIAQNEVEVVVLPLASQQATYTGTVTVMTRAGKNPSTSTLNDAMQQLGYNTGTALTPETALLITDYPTAEQLAWVRAGGDMLFLSEGSAGSPFFWKHGRGGTYSGQWISSFSWLRPGIYRRIPMMNPLTLPFMDMMPGSVILGLPVEDTTMQADILAGQLAGWLHHPAAHTVQFRYGQGRVIMTTFRLQETLGYHPLAVAMLHDLVDHLTSDNCQPILKANF